MAKKTRLTIKEIDSVGVVDEGDNPPASLLFWKRRKHAPEVGEVTLKGVLMPDEITSVEEGATPEPVEPVGEIDKQVEAEAVEVEAEDLAKSLQEEVSKAHAERDAALADLAAEVEKRRLSEWIGKARPYELLLGPADEMGPALGRIADVLPDEYARLEAAFKAALARTDLAKILVEVGKDTGETGTPVEQRDSWVKEYRKANPTVSEADVRGLFWKSHPELKQASRERG